MRFVTGVRTDVGRVRTVNEDAVSVSAGLAVVADGMGGHRGGEVASQIAVEAVGGIEDLRDLDDLVEGVRTANANVMRQSMQDLALVGMGTTLCAIAALSDDGTGPTVGVVNVGDSRVYLLDREGLRQISEDHSFVETLVREGRLTPAQAEVHPQRNVLTRALGIEADLVVDAWRVAVADGDRFLLCSDGLFNEVGEPTIASVLADTERPGDAAARLVDLALEGGARDNVSCVVVDIEDSGSAGPPAPRAIERVAGLDGVDDAAAPNGDTTAESWIRRGSTRTGDDAAAPPPARPPRATWRVGVLVLAVVATLAAAAGAVGWFARNTWWVKADAGEVAVFQGPPDGVLWIDPLVKGTDIRVADLTDALQRTVAVGMDFGSDRDAAEAYVERLAASTTTSPTTTTTTTTTPTAATPTPTPTVTGAPPPGATATSTP